MNWKYFIPHNLEDDRVISEDIFLLPEEGECISLWLTVSGKEYFDSFPKNEHMDMLLKEIEKEFNNKGYYLKGNEMYINQEDFSLQELLYWTKVWLFSQGQECDELIPGTLQEFRKHEVVNALEKQFEEMAKRYSANN